MPFHWHSQQGLKPAFICALTQFASPVPFFRVLSKTAS
jgi:hypothetical protein